MILEFIVTMIFIDITIQKVAYFENTFYSKSFPRQCSLFISALCIKKKIFLFPYTLNIHTCFVRFISEKKIMWLYLILLKQIILYLQYVLESIVFYTQTNFWMKHDFQKNVFLKCILYFEQFKFKCISPHSGSRRRVHDWLNGATSKSPLSYHHNHHRCVCVVEVIYFYKNG